MQRVIRKLATGIRVVAIAAACALPSLSMAQEEERPAHTFDFTAFLGAMGGGGFEDPTDGSDRDLEQDTVFGLFVNLAADPERHYELMYAKLGTEVEGSVPFDLDVQYLHIGGTVSYPQAKYVNPFIGVTIGATKFSPDATGLDDETKGSLSIGGGMRFPVTDYFGLRLDFRAFVTFLENDSEIFCRPDAGGTACLIKPKSDTFIQYAASLGFSVGF